MDLAVKNREKLGKANKKLRIEGIIPAELYGRGIENKHLSVDARDFSKVFEEAGENKIINLVIDGEKHSVLIHDIDRNRLTGEIDHIDFYKINLGEKIKAPIPLVFVNESPVVRDKLAILNKSLSEVEVEVLPSEIPPQIEVDLSLLDNIDKSIYIKDLKFPEGIKVLVDPETTVASTVPPQKEEEKSEVIDVSKVEVEGKKKEETGEESKEKTTSDKGQPKKS